MNSDFEKRQKQVLAILKTLAEQANTQKQLLVFIGGSAVQSALPKPQRLSIDLDLFYDGDAEQLLTVLTPEYLVQKRPVQRHDIFAFYKAVKEKTLVKIDIARFSLTETGKPYQATILKTQNETFQANVASFDYLLAAKFSSLAIDTIGRRSNKTDFQMNLVKDVFDANCLLDQTKPTAKTGTYFEEIITIQNQLRETQHSTANTLDSSIQILEKSIYWPTLKGVLQNFNEYLLSGSISIPDYWKMAYRIMAYLNAYKKDPAHAIQAFAKIEKQANDDYANRAKMSELENQLRQKGINADHLHKLKTLVPKALVYLHSFHYT